MDEVRKHLDAADELIVVCPVYFAGAPAQMKALLDRHRLAAILPIEPERTEAAHRGQRVLLGLGGGGPAYGKKNAKKKGNGRGGRR